jgi:hypothetical protein
MSGTETTKKLPYHVFPGGISVCRESHNEEGDWYPPQILPYFWKDNVLKVSRSLPELGFEKAVPVNANTRFPNHTDFFIVLGVVLCGYAKVDGYMPVFLEKLTGEEALLWSIWED